MGNGERIKSGIPGLDALIEGGFEKGSLIEIAGSEGTFKSTFAIQFAVEGIRSNEKVTYISLEEPIQSFRQTAKEFGFDQDFAKVDFESVDINQFINEVSHTVNADVAQELAKKIIDLIDGPDRLILDTATTMALYSARTSIKNTGSELKFVSPSAGDIRVMLFNLADELRKKGCTVLFLAEAGEGDLYLPEQVLKYICDAKIELKKSNLGTESPRTVVIHKMRHTKHPLDEMTLNPTKNGIEIKPLS